MGLREESLNDTNSVVDDKVAEDEMRHISDEKIRNA